MDSRDIQKSTSKSEDVITNHKAAKAQWQDGKQSPTGHESLMDVALKNLLKDVYKKGFTPKRTKKKVKGIKKMWYSPSFARLKDILTERPMKEGVLRDSSMDLINFPGYEGSDYVDSDDEDNLETETRDVKDRRTVEVKAKDLVENMKAQYEELLERDLLVLKERCDEWVNHLVDRGRQQFLKSEQDDINKQFRSVINDMRHTIKRFKLRTRRELFAHYQKSRREALKEIVTFFRNDVNLRTELIKKFVEAELNFKLKRISDDIDEEYTNKLSQKMRIWELKLQRLVERQKQANEAYLAVTKMRLEEDLKSKMSKRSERMDATIEEYKKSLRYSSVGVLRQLDAQDAILNEAEKSLEKEPSSCSLATKFLNFIKHFDSWHLPWESREKPSIIVEEVQGETAEEAVAPPQKESIIMTTTWKEVVDELLSMYQRLVDYVINENKGTADFLLSEQALLKLKDKLIARKEADLQKQIMCEMRMKELKVEDKSKEKDLSKGSLGTKSLTAKGIVTSIIDYIIRRATAVKVGWSLETLGGEDMEHFMDAPLSSYKFLMGEG